MVPSVLNQDEHVPAEHVKRGLLKRMIDRATVIGAKDRPVFIGASPRSGTTLLRTMLNSHPELAIPRESRFLAPAFLARESFGDLTDTRNRERLVTWIMGQRGFAKLGLDREDAIRRMMTAPGLTLGSVVGTPLVMYSEGQGAARWGDKRPAHIRCTGRIFSMFPDAQFVHLVRDPRASVASIQNVGWYDGSAPKALELWERSINAAVAAKAALRTDQFYELHYEDLLRDPSTQIEQLVDWLGLAPDGIARMLDFHRESDVPTNRYHWKVSEPLDPATATRWRKSLDPDAVALVEQVVGDHMDRLGYERDVPEPAPPTSMIDEYKERVAEKWTGDDTTRQLDHPGLAALLTDGQRRRARFLGAARTVKRT